MTGDVHATPFGHDGILTVVVDAVMELNAVWTSNDEHEAALMIWECAAVPKAALSKSMNASRLIRTSMGDPLAQNDIVQSPEMSIACTRLESLNTKVQLCRWQSSVFESADQSCPKVLKMWHLFLTTRQEPCLGTMANV